MVAMAVVAGLLILLGALTIAMGICAGVGRLLRPQPRPAPRYPGP
jgi:hypothetical protein